MKTLMTTTALVVATALPVTATAMEKDTPFADYSTQADASAEILASNLIGMRVYTSDSEVNTTFLDEIDGDWNDIGEVSDVVMSRDGETQSILLDIGGFLGIGEKTIAVDMDDLRYVADKDDAGDFFLVFTADKAMLEDAPAFDFDRVGEWTSAAWAETKASAEQATEAVSTRAEAAAEATETTVEGAYASAKETAKDAVDATKSAAAEAGTEIQNATAALTAPAITRDGYESLAEADMTTEMLTGAPVYDTNDEWIGEVSQLVVNDEGAIEKAVLDVGGFLGIGEKPVATDMESLTIKREMEGDSIRVYVDATKAELENMPEYSDS